jgi:hypothetical protein
MYREQTRERGGTSEQRKKKGSRRPYPGALRPPGGRQAPLGQLEADSPPLGQLEADRPPLGPRQGDRPPSAHSRPTGPSSASLQPTGSYFWFFLFQPSSFQICYKICHSFEKKSKTSTPPAHSNPPFGHILFHSAPASPYFLSAPVLFDVAVVPLWPQHMRCRTSTIPIHTPASLVLRHRPPRIRSQPGTLHPRADAVYGGHHTQQVSGQNVIELIFELYIVFYSTQDGEVHCEGG